MVVQDVWNVVTFQPGATEAANKNSIFQVREGEIFGV